MDKKTEFNDIILAWVARKKILLGQCSVNDLAEALEKHRQKK